MNSCFIKGRAPDKLTGREQNFPQRLHW